MQMDFDAIPKLVGATARDRVSECMNLLLRTRWPLYLVGPSGSGKSVVGMNLCKMYGQKHGVPGYYVQLSPDQTKTSIILGLRLVNGSLKPVKGVVAEAMERGGIVFVDEATHSTQDLLLMFNSILDRTSVTSIGDEIVYAQDTFRVIFGSNASSYAGNVRLPQSFAQRVITFPFDYPTAEDEEKIADRIVADEFDGTSDVPQSVMRYVTAFVRESRSDTFPLSARNIAAAIIRLTVTNKQEGAKISPYFTNGSSAESIRRTITKRILGKEVNDTSLLTQEEVRTFLTYVSAVGVDRFRDILLSACMYHLDVDGAELYKDSIRSKLATSSI